MGTTKEERIRREAMALAYHIVKREPTLEEGMQKLQERLDRNQQTNCPCFVKDQSLRVFETELKRTTMITSTAMSLMVLRDKFSFGHDRMERFMEAYIENADSIYGGWIDWEDITDYIKEQTGLDLLEYLKKSATLVDRMEDRLSERTVFVGDGAPAKIPE